LQVIILAAGIEERLKPATNTLLKGLIETEGEPLLEYSLNALKENGIRKVIIVIGFLGEAIEQKLGKAYRGLKITLR
jgi:MurNAc alpha-1-phosphate uridylyltransferase